jgi:hypothetical protein
MTLAKVGFSGKDLPRCYGVGTRTRTELSGFTSAHGAFRPLGTGPVLSSISPARRQITAMLIDMQRSTLAAPMSGIPGLLLDRYVKPIILV